MNFGNPQQPPQHQQHPHQHPGHYGGPPQQPVAEMTPEHFPTGPDGTVTVDAGGQYDYYGHQHQHQHQEHHQQQPIGAQEQHLMAGGDSGGYAMIHHQQPPKKNHSYAGLTHGFYDCPPNQMQHPQMKPPGDWHGPAGPGYPGPMAPDYGCPMPPPQPQQPQPQQQHPAMRKSSWQPMHGYPQQPMHHQQQHHHGQHHQHHAGQVHHQISNGTACAGAATRTHSTAGLEVQRQPQQWRKMSLAPDFGRSCEQHTGMNPAPPPPYFAGHHPLQQPQQHPSDLLHQHQQQQQFLQQRQSHQQQNPGQLQLQEPPRKSSSTTTSTTPGQQAASTPNSTPQAFYESSPKKLSTASASSNGNGNGNSVQSQISQSLTDFQRRKNSLRQFASQLRSSTFFTNCTTNSTPAHRRYTPPPMLEPRRKGSGLFCRVSRKPSEFRKQSAIEMAADVIMEEDIPTSSASLHFHGAPTTLAHSHADSGFIDDTDPMPADVPTSSSASGPTDDRDPASTAPPHVPIATIKPSIDNRFNRPQRKHGLFLGGQENSMNGLAAELEALRKESAESTKLSIGSRKCSMRASTSSSDDVIRKLSTVSVSVDPEAPALRKASTMSETYYDYTPCESDSKPHINLGKAFQARVRKWADREIYPHELEAIPDRDEAVFDCSVIEHLDEETVAAYEALACSAAVPHVGRNKELALHILMENKGNLQAAVMDLLRCDTLDWEQYPIVFNYLYDDLDNWSAEDVNMFQDAIYKSEKDFHQVAAEIGRSVRQCVAFYYFWKKACPEDYRKLRNLRRKRQLLEQQLDLASAGPGGIHPGTSRDESSDEEDAAFDDNSRSPIRTKHDVGSSSPEYARPPTKVPRIASPSAIIERKNSSTPRFVPPPEITAKGLVDHAQLFPWLHAENGVFPAASPAHSYSQPSSVGPPSSKDFFMENSGGGERSFNPDILHTKIANIHRVTAVKKGAQPSADGFFHCRLCDKRFEKVKSLNAHMKSHAMKARAEAEAQAQASGGPSHLQGSQNQQNQVQAAAAVVAQQHQQQERARNLALLRQRQQVVNGLSPLDSLNLQHLSGAGSGPNISPGQIASGGSPLSMAQLQRMGQFAVSAATSLPMSLGSSPLSAASVGMFTPDVLSAMQQLATNFPSQGGLINTQAGAAATTASALQQLHSLQQQSATIIN